MPRKVRELRRDLQKAGYRLNRTRGSHTTWDHPDVPESITISGGDGEDAKSYQEKATQEAIRKAIAAQKKKQQKKPKP